MGGSIAGAFCRWLKLFPGETQLVLMGGVAAGFGAVFGTPFAGAVFAMEVLTRGRIRYRATVPCLLAAFVGEQAIEFMMQHVGLVEVGGEQLGIWRAVPEPI